jgi:hypothetical protein
MAEDEQLFEKIAGSEDPVEIWILEQTAHSRNELIAIAHRELIVSNFGNTASGVIGCHQCEFAINSELCPFSTSSCLSLNDFRVMNPDLGYLLKQFGG